MAKMFVKGKVSIVTPVYNGERYLPPMLDSVLKQTYPEVELILVDDGSADGTVQAAEEYREKFADRGYEYSIIQAKHGGAAAAINQGLPLVTGEYLIWPDSDDRLEPASIEKRVRFLEKYPEYQCVRTLPYYFSQKTGERTRDDEKTGDLLKEDLFWDILESKTFVCCGCYMLKSECFFKIYPERRIPEYHVGQNFQMLLPYMYRYKCLTISEKLYGVCVRAGSHSRTALTQEEEEQKYRDYESLVEEIANICGIQDKESRDRILCWKARRRYMISLKYNRKRQAVKALGLLYKCGGLKIYKVLKDSLWACLENIRAVKKYRS